MSSLGAAEINADVSTPTTPTQPQSQSQINIEDATGGLVSPDSKAGKLLSNILASNPYFAAGGGLMVLGAVAALARNGIKQASALAYSQMLVDLEIPSRDKSYLWFLEWMAKYPHRRSRHFGIETAFEEHTNGSISTKFSMIPGPGNHLLRYKGAFIFVNRERSSKMLDLTNAQPFETVKLTTLYRDRELLTNILTEAKDFALKANEGKTVVYTSTGHEWRPFGDPRRKRSLDSVILDKGIKEKLYEDVNEFLSTSNWYYDRGIPYRRGYLLHGTPGSGKTSFIQALAGQMDYDICILNLSEANLTDDRMNHLMNHIPKRSILLLEDIDAAFNKREQTGEKGFKSFVTFSGLLNALDGVASAEEIITFMTTNHPEKLDPALLRPGRVDFQQEIGSATNYQIEQLFLKFYPDETELCEKFVQGVKNLNCEVSMAQLQGYFIYNKMEPKKAVEFVGALKPRNRQ